MVSFDTIDHGILIKLVQRRVRDPHLPVCFCIMLFDRWMAKQDPQCPFERFADDAIADCRTEMEAQEVRATMPARMRECGLEPSSGEDEDSLLQG